MELEDECMKLTRTDCTKEGALADLLVETDCTEGEVEEAEGALADMLAETDCTEGEVEEAEEKGALAGLLIKSKGLG